MTNVEYVVKLQRKESELVKIANYSGFFDDDCRDAIQDLYVKLLLHKNIDRYVLDGEPNMYIIFAILKNIITTDRKRNERHTSVDVYDFDIEHNDEFKIDKYEFVLSKIETIPYWFDKEILKLYIMQNKTIRGLAKETKIPYNVIQHIVHNFKVSCKVEFSKSN